MPKTEYKFNLNDKIQVELTPHGVMIFEVYAIQIAANVAKQTFDNNLKNAIYESLMNNIIGTTFSGQIHLFMEVFGTYVGHNIGTEYDVIKSFNVLVESWN